MSVSEAAEYVRSVERYLCQRNGGHLVRIVGPAFELVNGWAARGVPLTVAMQGIDRSCARQEAKPARRRPLRIEFCAADVEDAFDAWRRAVGVGATAGASEDGEARARKGSLAAHIERALARLASARGRDTAATLLQHRADEVIRELEQMLAAAPRARGEARVTIVARLGELDRILLDAAVEQLEATLADALRVEAAAELAPFGSRMAEDVRTHAVEKAFRRIVRDSLGLPTLLYDA